MRPIRCAVPTALITAALVLAGCSSSGPSSAGPASGPSSPQATAAPPPVDQVQHYIDQVNALCDALLPKIEAVMHGGHPDTYPVAEYFKELPAHTELERGFDAQLAKVTVPPAAKSAAAALKAYIAFADKIDRSRLAAAHRGQAAFDKEIRAENAEFPTDPIAAARTAAGFSESCDAR